MRHEDGDRSELLAEHLAGCTDADAAIVVDGNADQVIADLVAAGWTLEAQVDLVLGKRVRFMAPPAN